MADLGLRPLSLGEILDRTFSLYRKHFVLFAGITAIPNLLVLAVNLLQTAYTAVPRVPRRVPTYSQHFQVSGAGLLGFGIGFFVVLIVYLVAFLFAQGGTVYAVSDLYLGRPTTIGESLGRMRGQLLSLFGVTLLNGLAVMGATLLFIVPGIYVACRLITCVPAALLEDLGPRSSLERSFSLTKDFAGRSFLIYFLYFVLVYAATALFTLPFTFLAVFAAMRNPESMRLWLALSNIGAFFAGVFVGPVLTIATAVFYYDLRVRKEAFDLQVMMNPNEQFVGAPSIVPRTLA